MHLLLLLVFFGVVGGAAYVIITRANELFCVSIRDGVCLVIRGNVPPRIWRELVTTARVNGIRRGTIRAVKQGGQITAGKPLADQGGCESIDSR